MADVFISCSRLDHSRVKPIVDRLSSLGYTTWWDKQSGARQAPIDEIELDAARCVLTVWSQTARDATHIYAESSRALDSGKLLQMRLDNAALPLPFDALPVADMSNERSSEWGVLEDALTRMIRDRTPPTPLRPVPQLGVLATPAAAGAPKLVAFASGATLLAYAGAVSAAANGVMSPEQLQIALTGMLGVGGVCATLSAYRLLTIARAGG